MKQKILFYITCCICCIAISSKEKNQKQLFTFLSSNEARIQFSNDIDETKLPGNALNQFAYMDGADVTFMSRYNYNILL